MKQSITHFTTTFSGGSSIFPKGMPPSKVGKPIFCRKLHENKRIWTQGCASLAPPTGSANDFMTGYCFFSTKYTHKYFGWDSTRLRLLGRIQIKVLTTLPFLPPVGRRPPPPPSTDHNFLNFMQCRGKSGNFVFWWPLEGWYPCYEQSWIRPCNMNQYLR